MDRHKDRFDELDEFIENRENIRRSYIEKLIPELDKVHDYNSKVGKGKCKNVLIIERAEYGAHGVLSDWLKQNQIKSVHFLAETNQYVARQIRNNTFYEFYFASNEIEYFDQEETVMVIENYDVLELKAREHLNRLVKDRIVNDYSVDSGKRKLDKLWYIIATAYAEGRFGHEPLNEKDISLFDYVIRLDK